MTPVGSFHPIPTDATGSTPVLFAFVTDTPIQRAALRQEILERLSAVTALGEALLTVEIEAHDGRSHQPFVEAMAILARDALGLLQVPPGMAD